MGEELGYKLQILYLRATGRSYSPSLGFSRAVSKRCLHPRYSQTSFYPHFCCQLACTSGAHFLYPYNSELAVRVRWRRVQYLSYVSVKLTLVYFKLVIYTSCFLMLPSPIKSSRNYYYHIYFFHGEVKQNSCHQLFSPISFPF